MAVRSNSRSPGLHTKRVRHVAASLLKIARDELIHLTFELEGKFALEAVSPDCVLELAHRRPVLSFQSPLLESLPSVAAYDTGDMGRNCAQHYTTTDGSDRVRRQ